MLGQMATPLLSIVVPTRNEAGNVGALFERLASALAGVDHEVCFVDDSDDDTPAALTLLEAERPERVRCLLRQDEERRGGLSTAVVAGLRMARGRWVCVMDADLQHPPELIPTMLDAARAGADLVVASRYVPGASSAGLDGRMRRLVSRGATAVARLLFTEARRSRDPLSGFFLCRRAVVDGIEFRPVGFKILLELLVCVPGLRVRDVPLDFRARSEGQSKASAAQGLLYLRHLRSLFFQVDGSARTWKFGLVGVSGLCLFLPLLWALEGPAHLPAALAFLPAFAVSLTWNTALNRRWTFADQRRREGRGDLPGYLLRALASGAVMYAAFLVLSALGAAVLLAGLGAALLAMLVNGIANRRAVRRGPRVWSAIAVDEGVQEQLEKLTAAVGADRAWVLPPAPGTAAFDIPGDLVERAVTGRRASLWTEAPSHKPQRRTNVALRSRLILPVVAGDEVLGVVVCERHATHGFGPEELEAGMHAVGGMLRALADAGVDAATLLGLSGGRPAAAPEAAARG